MSLWLPRPPPLALIGVVRRSYGTHFRVDTYLRAQRALPVPRRFIQAYPSSSRPRQQILPLPPPPRQQQKQPSR